MTSSGLLAGRRALITGGAGGLGGAIASDFSRAGAAVAICGRDPARLAVVGERIKRESGRAAIRVDLDLLDPSAAEKAASKAAEGLGGIDILVNAAGAPIDGRIETVSLEGWRRSFDVKVFGAVAMIKAALPYMKDAGKGVIITLSGILGREPAPTNVVSGAMNAAIENLMKSVATDVARYGIRAIAVRPGYFDTDRIRTMLNNRSRDLGRSVEDLAKLETAAVPTARFGQPDELASLVTYLASDRASYMTGTVITMDGGLLRGT